MFYCQNCGAASHHQSRFCHSCGRPFGASEPATTRKRIKASAFLSWGIILGVLIIVVFGTFKALPLIASASSQARATNPAAHSSPTTHAFATPTPVPPPDFQAFAGNWFGHGRFLTFASSGDAHYGARTYVWCGAGVPQPCDTLQGNEIIGGIDEQLVFTRTNGSNAYGTITTSTIGDKGEQVTVSLEPNHTLDLYHGNMLYTTLCGPQSPAGYCGA